MSACRPLPSETEIIIVGGGPVGLTLANALGLAGISVLLLEEREGIIDYPRGVGMDDECLRSFQSLGLIDKVLPHTTPNQWLRFLTARGRVFASVEPRTDVFGWPRRNAFIQPLVDKVLLEGLERCPSVQVRFGAAFLGYREDGNGIMVAVREGTSERQIAARLLVGCDGGKSSVRKAAGIDFEGKTESTRWLVVDVANDPVGTPNAVLICDPKRPTVSIALPHGVRRFEFMVFDGESEEEMTRPDAIRRLLAGMTARPERVDVIRARVYMHHARLAASFRAGRVLLAGDAAHLMPVWQGQGYNSGIRDATNLGWKLAAVLQGWAGDALLDTYEAERRAHAAAMIAISVTAGRIFSPVNPILAALRDVMSLGLNFVPPAKRYIMEMRFKPMPRYTAGIVLPETEAAGRKDRAKVVGRLFPQPAVTITGRGTAKLDEALGTGFAVLAWGDDPARYMDASSRAFWRRIGARFLCAVPATQVDAARERLPGTEIVGDPTGRLKDWFGDAGRSVVFLRPDRFVAAVSDPQSTDVVTQALAARLAAKIEQKEEADDAPGSMHVAYAADGPQPAPA